MRSTGQNIHGLGTRLIFAIVAILGLALTAVPSRAATVRVPADQPTIQAGVDAASESDTVLVAPGTYTGPGNYDILLDGKGLVVRSESGPAATVIDCEGNGRGFTLEGPMMFDPVIEGFTVKNGNGGERGGGVYCSGCSATIKGCVFLNGHAVDGGAVFVSGDGVMASVSVVKCTFVRNIASFRGGITLGRYGATIHVENCIAIENQTLSGHSLFFSYAGNIVTLICCNNYGNLPADWFGNLADQYGVDGNMRVDPMFCDVESGDFGLHTESPMRPEASPCGELVGALGVSCSDCYDIDSDGWCAIDDNCPVHPNADQLDSDANGTGDVCEDGDLSLIHI